MSHPEQTTARTARTVNVSYLVMGLVFLGIAGTWALRAGDVVDTSQMQWLVPLVLVAAGVIGLVAFTAKGVVRGRRTRDTRDHVDTDDAPTSFDPYTPYTSTSTSTSTETDTDTEPTTRIEGDRR